MSETVLSVIPTDPHWQPADDAAALARLVWKELVPRAEEIEVTWHEHVTLVDCGSNLDHIGCPRCQAEIDSEWWSELVGERYEAGFDHFTVAVPCCSAKLSLNDLDYDWPCGFARFELEAWSPDRGWLTAEELSRLASALGHGVRQIMARI